MQKSTEIKPDETHIHRPSLLPSRILIHNNNEGRHKNDKQQKKGHLPLCSSSLWQMPHEAVKMQILNSTANYQKNVITANCVIYAYLGD